MISRLKLCFSSDKFKIKVIANDPETIEDSKIEICKDLFIVNIVYNDVLVGFWNLIKSIILYNIFGIRVLNTFYILSFCPFGFILGVSDTFQKQPVEEEVNSEDNLEKTNQIQEEVTNKTKDAFRSG